MYERDTHPSIVLGGWLAVELTWMHWKPISSTSAFIVPLVRLRDWRFFHVASTYRSERLQFAGLNDQLEELIPT
jgi:hypothetical protein